MNMRNLVLSFLFMVVGLWAAAQSRVLSGKVLDDQDGKPIPGVTVQATGYSGTGNAKVIGTSTDMKGAFTLNVPSGFTSLTFTFIGMEPQTVLIGEKRSFTVRLKAASTQVEEVVVTALGLTREAKALSYSRQGVDADALSENKSSNFIASLAGKVAGVNIVPPGVSNGTARIVIRGTNSLTGNAQPLFVVDGMIIENQPGDEDVTVSGAGALDYGNPVSDISPDDIANIEILKGPNAAALYGSRASQGVVLITTKRADSFDKIRVTFNGSYQFEAISQYPEYQNAYGTGENSFKLGSSATLPVQTDDALPNLSLLAAGSKRRSWGAPMWGQRIIGFDGRETLELPQPDNVRDFYDVATRISNSIAVEGGSKQNNFRVSYTNSFGNSVVHGINRNDRNALNVRVFNTVAKWVTLDTKVTYSREQVKNRQYMNGSDRNPIYAFTTLPRDLSIDMLKNYKDAEGNETIPIGERGYNPYWNIYENTNKDVRDRVNGSMNLELKFTSYLKFMGKFGMDAYWWNGTEFNNLGALRDPLGSMKNFNTNYVSTNLEGLLVFNKTFWNKLSVNAMAGMSRYSRNSERRTQSITTLLMPGFDNISNSGEFPTVGQTRSAKKIRSVYGSVSLGFNNYLFVDVTARNDWSSTLPIENCSYFYPSFGGSFIFSEAFRISPKVLSFGKIRASYAYAGADTDPYRISQTYPLTGIYNGGPLQTIGTTLNNADLKPEQNRSFEAGADLRFLSNRLSLDVTYYDSKAINLITSVMLPYSSGYTRKYLNTGKIRNWGWEVILSGTPIRTKIFSWEATVNWAKNNSRVLKVVPGNPNLTLTTWFGRLNVNLEEGMPYGVLRGRAWKRDEYGRKLVDSKGLPIATGSDAYLGTATPKWTGSFSSSFKIKDFTVSFMLDGRIGGTMFSGTYRRGTIAGVLANTLEGREEWYVSNVIYGEDDDNLTGGLQFDDVYYEDGTPSHKYVKPTNGTFSNIDEMQCFDASFIKLREVAIGYSMPRKLLKNTPFGSVRVSLVGRNLGILYQNTPKGIDPEAMTTSGNGQGIEYGSIPPVTSFGFDVKITF